jgi:tetratricopeptide (TPR) repeat protein
VPTIGFSMIVKNGGEDLRACLESVRAIVDQMVIADTGSTDDTVAIAEEFGATVVPCAWNDHYAEARNVALAAMTTDWVLVLDADEELSPEAAAALPGLVAETSAQIGGYRLTIRNYANEVFASVVGSLGHRNTDTYERAKGARTYSEHTLCRLFRRRQEIYFSGRLHEAVEMQIVKAGWRCPVSELLILHYGTLAEKSSYEKKQHRYYRMLRMAVEETPELPHLWVQLAITERTTYDNLDEAIVCARRAVTLSPREFDAWSLLAGYLGEKKRHEEAVEALGHLPESGDWGITRAWAMGDHLHDLGRFKEARSMYVLAYERAKKSAQALPKEFLTTIESRIGYTEVRIGMRTVGFRKLVQARDATPMVLSNHERLMKAYVAVQDDRKAAEAAETALKYWSSEQLYTRAAALMLRIKEQGRASRLIEAGIQRFPGSESLRRLAAG